MFKGLLWIASGCIGFCLGYYATDFLGGKTEKIQEKTSYVVNKEQIEADLIGCRVTMENNRRWVFMPDQDIKLSVMGGNWSEADEIEDGSKVTSWRVMAYRTDGSYLSGFINVRYEWVVNKWKITEVTMMGGLNEHPKPEKN